MFIGKFNLRSDLPYDFFRFFGCLVFQNNHELITADSVTLTVLSNGSSHTLCDRDNKLITFIMSQAVIYLLQIVGIHHYVGNHSRENSITLVFLQKCRSVSKTGHRIHIGHSCIDLDIGILLNLLIHYDTGCIDQKYDKYRNTDRIDIGIAHYISIIK